MTCPLKDWLSKDPKRVLQVFSDGTNALVELIEPSSVILTAHGTTIEDAIAALRIRFKNVKL